MGITAALLVLTRFVFARCSPVLFVLVSRHLSPRVLARVTIVVGSKAHPVYTFGPFRVDFESCEILKHGLRLHFQNQPMCVLRLLVEHPGQLMNRLDLQQQLWPGVPALETDDSLNSSVKKLRETLGDDPGKPLYIETIPRRGYRFIAPVQVETPAPPPAVHEDSAAQPEATRPSAAEVGKPTEAARLWWRGRRVAAIVALLPVVICAAIFLAFRFTKKAAADWQINSIVVLPFDNLSADASQQYFAEGLTDALTTDLAQLGSIKVISRTSASLSKKDSKSLPKIRAELGVDAVVEGSVARSGGKVRVNAQLISTADDRHLWAQSFERDEGDILSLQDDLARSVAQRIQAALSPAQRARMGETHTVSIQAYEAYLAGMHHLNLHRTNGDLQKSLEEFGQAAALDPKLAEAYAGIAHSYNLLGDYDEIEGKVAGPEAEKAARRALELDDSMASAHAALAFALWKYKWDWSAGEAEFRKSLALNPNDAHTQHIYAILLACRGDFTGADEHIRKAQELDPLSMIIRTNRGWLHYFQHDYPSAEAAYQDVLKMDPGFLPARQKLWIAYALDGKTDQAEAELENLMRLFGHPDLLLRVQNTALRSRFQAGVNAYAESGLLTPYERARYFGLLGRGPEAVQALSEAAQQQSAWMVYLGIEPAFDRVRNAPGFDQLLQEAHIPQIVR